MQSDDSVWYFCGDHGGRAGLSHLTMKDVRAHGCRDRASGKRKTVVIGVKRGRDEESRSRKKEEMCLR